MSFAGYSLDDAAPAWGVVSNTDPIRDALKKEKLLNEIAASQEDLRTLLGRAQAVQEEVNKLTSGNETLQMYIDNLTVQMAKRR